MNDVPREILLARGDEDFRARDFVRAIAGGNRARLDEPKIGAAMGLGQAHRPRPFPGRHFRQIAVLEVFTGVGLDGPESSVCKTGIGAERHIGRADHLLDREAYRVRQALAAILWRQGKACPACLSVKIVCLLEARGCANGAVFKGAAFDVALLIERLQNRLAKLRRLFENAGDQIGGGILESGQGR